MDSFRLPLAWLVALVGIWGCVGCTSPLSAQTIPVDRPQNGITIYGEPDPYIGFRTAAAINLSPDGKTMASIDHVGIRLFDLEESRFVGTAKKAGYLSVHFSPNGDRLYAVKAFQPYYLMANGKPKEQTPVEDKTTLTVFDPKTMEEIDSFRFEGPRRKYVVIGSTGRVAALGDETSIMVIDTITGEVKAEVPCSITSNQLHFALVQEDRVLVYCDGSRVKAFDLTTEKQLSKREWEFIGEVSYGLAVSKDSRFLACWQPNRVKQFDVGQNKEVSSFDPKGYPQRVSFSPDGSLLATCGQGQEINYWETNVYLLDGKRLKTIRSGYAKEIVFQEDGSAVYILSNNGGMQRAPLKASAEQINFGKPVAGVRPIPGEPRKLAIFGTNSVRLFDLDDHRIGEAQLGLSVPKAVFIDSDRYFYCCQLNQKLTLALRPDNKGGREKRSTLVANGPITPGPFDLLDDYFNDETSASNYRQGIHLDMCTAEDGKHFYNMYDAVVMKFSGRGAGKLINRKVTIQKRTLEGKVVDRWELQTEKLKGAEGAQGYYFQNLCSVSPDGQLAALGKDIFDVPGNQWLASIADNFNVGIQAATEFSADSKWLAVSQNDKLVVFDTETFESVYQVKGSGLLYFSFSEDGKRLVVAEGGKSGFVKLVSCGDWNVLFERSETKAARTSVSLLEGGKSIYFGLNDYRIEVWNWKAME